jgi:hypothetical protein
MTNPNRPSGVTPRGLPYPGSANIHAETPKALQALAEATSAQLSSVGGGLIFDFFVGNKQTDGSGMFRMNPGVEFPKLKVVYGVLAQLGVHLGGTYHPGEVTGQSSLTSFYVVAGRQYLQPAEGQETFFNTTVSICAVAWGTAV